MPKSPSRKTADLDIAIADASRSSGLGVSPTRKSKAQDGRIMYVECKAGGLAGAARIGRVTFFDEHATWHTPGRSPIAGDHKGREAVFAQFGRYGGDTGGTFKAKLLHVLKSDDGL